MNDLYYKMFKLNSGETIVCTTDDSCEKLFSKKSICIMDPVQINNVKMPRGEYLIESYVLTPWLSFTDQPIYDISTVSIIVASDIQDSLKTNYLEFVKKSNRDVVASEDIMEEIFNELEKGSEDNEENEIPKGTRVLH